MEKIINTSKQIVELLAQSGLNDVQKATSLEIASALVTSNAIAGANEFPKATQFVAEALQLSVPEARLDG